RAVIGVLHHAVDKFNQHFDRSLQFSGHAAGGAARGDREHENEDEGNEEGKKYAVDMDGPKCAAPRIQGEVRQVMLDVARHPLRSVFLEHHSKAHKSHLSRIIPNQYPNCAVASPTRSGTASSFRRASARYSASTNHSHFSATPANMARLNLAAPAIPGANARQPNTALPTATISPPASAAMPDEEPL